MRSNIKYLLREGLFNLSEATDYWYHGTPDVRELEKIGGFSNREISISYIRDIKTYNKVLQKLKKTREDNDEDAYFKTLDLVSKLKENFKFRKPIFLTNDYRVANTYADSTRSFDYQNSVEKVLKVIVTVNNGVIINATGDRFRFIDVNKVKRGFVNAGVSEKEFDEVLSKFNFSLRDKTKIKTDMIGAMGEWFKFDFIDVIGVLDSYQGGSRKSTVRMVFNPSDIKIIK